MVQPNHHNEHNSLSTNLAIPQQMLTRKNNVLTLMETLVKMGLNLLSDKERLDTGKTVQLSVVLFMCELLTQ